MLNELEELALKVSHLILLLGLCQEFCSVCDLSLPDMVCLFYWIVCLFYLLIKLYACSNTFQLDRVFYWNVQFLKFF